MGPDGVGHGFRGVFHGEPSVDGILQTFEWEGLPGHVSLEKVVFEEHDGRTLAAYQSLEDRDGMVAGGMEAGVREGDERLTGLLAELQNG